MIMMNLFAEQQYRHRHRGQTYGHGQGKEGEAGMNGDSSMKICTLSYIK